MNEKAVKEIGSIIHAKNKFELSWPPVKEMTAEEIINTHEYKMFKKKHPEICKIVEEDGDQK